MKVANVLLIVVIIPLAGYSQQGQEPFACGCGCRAIKDTVLLQSMGNIFKYDGWNRRSFVDTSCAGYYSGLAKSDIAENKIKLLTSDQRLFKRENRDTIFERTYNIRFQMAGGEIGERTECIEIYNRCVFRYLDRKYGCAWRDKVKVDLAGLR